MDAIKTYRVIISEVAGLGRDYVTPKHGLPSGYDKNRSW